MAEFKGTPHNSAKYGDIAKTVLMPGDPLRAKYIADTYLQNVKQFNSIRGMYGFTGTYMGKEVSIMGHGMGIPSMGIYSYELYKFYGVENIIRIGSAGGMAKGIKLFDLVIVDGSYSESSYAKTAFGYKEDLFRPSEELTALLVKCADGLNKEYYKGIVFSGDAFYSTVEPAPCDYDIVCGEMESFALFANAKYLNKKAACLLTISDLPGEVNNATPEQRQTAFKDMMEVALKAAVSI